MPREDHYDYDYGYDPDDPDAPQSQDVDGTFDGDDTDVDYADADPTDVDDGGDTYGIIACPQCGRSLHPSAALCPHCGEWLLDESPARRRSRGWFWPMAVGLLIAMILVFWSGLRLW